MWNPLLKKATSAFFGGPYTYHATLLRGEGLWRSKREVGGTTNVINAYILTLRSGTLQYLFIIL